MEVINCLENFNYKKTDFFEGKSLKRFIKPNIFQGIKWRGRAKDGLYFSVESDLSLKDKFSPSLSLQGIKNSAIFWVKKILRFSKFTWFLPIILACVLSLFFVFWFVSYSESFIRTIKFNSNEIDGLDSLDIAMNEFAFDKKSYFDSEGNIFSEDGTKVAVNSVSMKQPVVFQNYTVKSGDTISGISSMFGLSNISTLIAINNIGNVRSIYSGQKLSIPSCDGLVHVVSKNETLDSISRKYDTSISDLLDVNDLSSETLMEGQSLFIPGARLDVNSLKKAMGEFFMKPLKAKYWLTDKFGPRIDPISGVASSHTGIDLACPTGTPIYASMSGKVAYTGFSSVYGNYVILNHYDGYQTLYGHMSKILVKKGDSVSQDTRIGLVGSTGYSTGSHLHFTVYKNSKLVDPLTVLK